MQNSKRMIYFSMLLATVAITFYHVMQRGISVTINPFISLTITYLVAIISTLLLMFVFPSKVSFIDSLKQANYASYLLGFAVVGIELGFLLVYRSGWNISVVTPFSGAISTIVLVILGLLFFNEQISLIKIVGVILCLVGVWLISK